MSRKPRKPTPRRRPTLAAPHPLLTFALLSALCVLLLYGKSLSNPFVYDDLDQIVRNPNLATLHNLTQRFLLAPVAFSNEFREATGPTGSTWRPIFWLSLALDRRLYGPASPTGFHATNLLLHWLDSVLLFTLFRQLRLRPLLAATATLLWLILPINSEAVAWVSGRAYLLTTFFLLLSLLEALSFLDRPRPLALAAAALASLAALMSNEAGLLGLPFTLLLAGALRSTPRSAATIAGAPSSPSSRPKSASSRPNPGQAKRAESAGERPAQPMTASPVVILLSTNLAAAALYLALRHHIGVAAGESSPALWAIAPTFWKYLSWILLPLHMSVERSTSTPPNLPSINAVLCTTALLVFLATSILLRKRLPAAAAGLAITALALLPFCGIVPLYQGMAERFSYIASFGVALTLTALAFAPPASWRRASLAALALFAFWSAVRLHARVADWSDAATLYQTSLAATPRSPGLYFNLAFIARERGDLQTAAANYTRATELRPTFQRAWASLGDVEARLGQPAKAVHAFGQALTLNPNDAPTTTSLAVSLADGGNRPVAEQTFHRAITLDPTSSATWTDLAVLLSGEGRIDEAIQAWQKAIDLNPTDATAYFDLAVLFQERGQDDLALPFYRKVLTLKPDDPDTLINISHLHTHH